MKTIGIIGLGRFGNLLKNIFGRHISEYKVITYSRSQTQEQLKNVCSADLVIPAVPISAFEDVIKQISPLLKNGSTLMDVSSVKEFPVKVMREYLPREVNIFATHPMFGPDSTKNGETFEDLKFIFSKVRGDNFDIVDDILRMFEKLGVEIIEMTPEEHDKQAAYTHFYAFLIGKIGIDLNVRKNQITTKGFEGGILYNQEAVENDSHQLFLDMYKYNSYAEKMLDEFGASLENITNYLKNFS